jgi:hypothetical protein
VALIIGKRSSSAEIIKMALPLNIKNYSGRTVNPAVIVLFLLLSQSPVSVVGMFFHVKLAKARLLLVERLFLDV